MEDISKKVTAWSVARYLFFLDPQREYFSNTKIEIVDEKKEYKSKPIIGNFRLNKILQIIQALYYACYKKPLFSDKMKAYEHGGIVSFICRNFNNLWREDIADDSKSLKKEQKEFIKKVFFYLRDNYSDKELRDLAHEDLAWMKAWRRKIQGGADEFIYDGEVVNYYDKLSGSMLKAMRITH
jgi:uncharacterized phage-associated protein